MNKSTDVVVHVNESLDKDKRKSLARDTNQLEGVMSADFSENRPHLMIVGFDPDRTQSLDVLTGVQSIGVNAQLIGWV